MAEQAANHRHELQRRSELSRFRARSPYTERISP
jgi:hypothetical protein